MPPQQSFKQQTLTEKVDEYKRDLDTIEELLVQIKREYDLYFAGARRPPRPPHELKTQLERMLRKWRTSTIQKIELTFRLNTLNSKFNAMNDVWEKVMKRREIDPHALSPFGPTHGQLAAELGRKNRPGEAAASASGALPVAQGSSMEMAAVAAEKRAVEDPEARMRRVYDQYVDAKKDMGESLGAISFDKFKGQLDKQVGQIRDKTKCKDVEFSVVRKDGKVSLTAKPIKE